MEKINIAELLRNCPRGMELDCTMFNDVTFECVDDTNNISIKTPCGITRLSKYGCYHSYDCAKCVIFPVGKTTWEGFQRPFKDGDILSYQCTGLKNRTIYIYRHHSRMNTSYYAALGGDLDFMVNRKEGCALSSYNDTARFATEEEKEKLFQAIKENGYKWNAETSTLEKLPKFKVGDKIRHKTHIRQGNVVTEIKDTHYILDDELALPFISQDEYELVPNKFDITTLVPFESRVLVRDSVGGEWDPGIWGFYNSNHKSYPYRLIGDIARYCIPYEGNEHLLGTTDDCDEHFKTWK